VTASVSPLPQRLARTSGSTRSTGVIVAYELLYRSSADRSAAVFVDDALATARVVHAAFHRIGIGAVVGREKALINVSAEFLLGRRVDRLPPNQVMLEIL
jgi:c-di-GMP phosphodiesterase